MSKVIANIVRITLTVVSVTSNAERSKTLGRDASPLRT